MQEANREKQREQSEAECADCNEALVEVWR